MISCTSPAVARVFPKRLRVPGPLARQKHMPTCLMISGVTMVAFLHQPAGAGASRPTSTDRDIVRGIDPDIRHDHETMFDAPRSWDRSGTSVCHLFVVHSGSNGSPRHQGMGRPSPARCHKLQRTDPIRVCVWKYTVHRGIRISSTRASLGGSRQLLPITVGRQPPGLWSEAQRPGELMGCVLFSSMGHGDGLVG